MLKSVSAILLYTSIYSLLLYPVLLYPNKNDSKLFNKIKQQYYKNLPADFIARIKSSKISKSLEQIPKEVYCNNNNSALKVSYVFLKEGEESIIVENVQNPYINRFQIYLEMYKKAKWFLDTKKNFNQIQNILYWKIINQNKKEYIVKTRQKRFRKSDFLILHISKKNYTIKKAIQYSNNKKIGKLSITYKKINGYTLPHQLYFIIKENQKNTHFNIIMHNYKTNIGINSNIIINLQDDCPSLNKFY